MHEDCIIARENTVLTTDFGYGMREWDGWLMLGLDIAKDIEESRLLETFIWLF